MTEPRKRGRPRKEKEPKPPTKPGRNPSYSEPTTRLNVRIPIRLNPAAILPENHKKIEELVVDFLSQK